MTPGHVLEPVPPGNLVHQRISRAGAALAGDLRVPGNHAAAAVAARERRPPVRRGSILHVYGYFRGQAPPAGPGP